jgi:TIR domain
MRDAVLTYDVFLSYNWREHAASEAIACALRDHGLRVFLDRWFLVPGRPWPQALGGILDTCRAVAAFLGPQGMGPWQQREKDLALDGQARTPTFSVIPVLLPGCRPGPAPPNTWVDLRAGLDDPSLLAVLTEAVWGEPPGPDLQKWLTATFATVRPYRSLRPFREEDAPFFFGREAFTARLAEAVAQHTLVAVVGALGSELQPRWQMAGHGERGRPGADVAMADK